jgi:hypothetical protein
MIRATNDKHHDKQGEPKPTKKGFQGYSSLYAKRFIYYKTVFLHGLLRSSHAHPPHMGFHGNGQAMSEWRELDEPRTATIYYP